MGKSKLKGYLANIGAAESNKCDCDKALPGTVRYFLFECPQWADQRWLLRDVADSRWGDLSYFLGERSTHQRPSGEPLDGTVKSWKPDLDVALRTVKFTLATG